MARFILEKKKVFEQYKKLKKDFLVSYSYKTNPLVGDILSEKEPFYTVYGFNYIEKIKNKKKVFFLSPIYTKEKIEEIIKNKIEMLIVDNKESLDLLLDNIDFFKDPLILLRWRLREHTIFTGKYYVFGFKTGEIIDLVNLLHKKGIRVGIHFHRKTQNIGEWDYKEEFLDSFPKEMFEKIEVVNSGGGLPIKYKNSSDKFLPEILEKLRDFRDFLDNFGIKHFIEPGRFIAGPPIKLEATVDGISGNTVFVDCSIYNTAPDIAIYHLRFLVENELEKGRRYLIKGCTPDSIDIFRYSVFLKDVKKGDKIVFLNAGAYNYRTTLFNLPEVPTEFV